MDLAQITLTLLALYAVLLPRADALRFFLAPGKIKCLKEEIHKGIIVSGEYALSESPGATATVTVVLFCHQMNTVNSFLLFAGN